MGTFRNSFLVTLSGLLLILSGCGGGSRGSYAGGRTVRFLGAVSGLEGRLATVQLEGSQVVSVDSQGRYEFEGEVESDAQKSILVAVQQEAGVVMREFPLEPIPEELNVITLNFRFDAEAQDIFLEEVELSEEQDLQTIDPLTAKAGELIETATVPQKKDKPKKKQDSGSTISQGGVAVQGDSPASPDQDKPTIATPSHEGNQVAQGNDQRPVVFYPGNGIGGGGAGGSGDDNNGGGLNTPGNSSPNLGGGGSIGL